MTPQAERLPETVEEMLLDAGHAQDEGLRAALLALGSLAYLPVPEPGPELAALLSPPSDQLERRRRIHQRRTTALGLALIAGMGLGVSGVAASSAGHGDPAALSVQHLLRNWTPYWSIAGAPSLTAGQERPDSAGGEAEQAAGHAGTADTGGPTNAPGSGTDADADPATAGGDDAGKNAAGSAEVPLEDAGSGEELASGSGNLAQAAVKSSGPPWAHSGSTVQAGSPICATRVGANISECNDKRGRP